MNDHQVSRAAGLAQILGLFVLGGYLGEMFEVAYGRTMSIKVREGFKPIWGFGTLLFLLYPTSRTSYIQIGFLVFCLEYLTGVACRGTPYKWDYGGPLRYVCFRTFTLFLVLGFMSRDIYQFVIGRSFK